MEARARTLTATGETPASDPEVGDYPERGRGDWKARGSAQGAAATGALGDHRIVWWGGAVGCCGSVAGAAGGSGCAAVGGVSIRGPEAAIAGARAAVGTRAGRPVAAGAVPVRAGAPVVTHAS